MYILNTPYNQTWLISIGNHMNSSAIWEIIALSHVLEEEVITRGEAE